MVTIIAENRKEEMFDKQTIENKLKNAGLPEKIAQKIADRVSKKVEDGWTIEKVMQETSVELRNLYDAIEKVYEKFKSSVSMGEHNVGEQRISENEYLPNEKPIDENHVKLKNAES